MSPVLEDICQVWRLKPTLNDQIHDTNDKHYSTNKNEQCQSNVINQVLIVSCPPVVSLNSCFMDRMAIPQRSGVTKRITLHFGTRRPPHWCVYQLTFQRMRESKPSPPLHVTERLSQRVRTTRRSQAQVTSGLHYHRMRKPDFLTPIFKMFQSIEYALISPHSFRSIVFGMFAILPSVILSGLQPSAVMGPLLHDDSPQPYYFVQPFPKRGR